MGKLRHNKDRLFLTGVEWKELGGFKEKKTGTLKRLPFDHCALSLVPFETPMMAPDGSVFELTRIVPFLKTHKKNPVSGEPLESRQLIALHFGKNTDGQLVCPVTGKVLTEHSRIVVVRPTGNVFLWDAIQQLCLGPKNMKDLLDDTPFTKPDLIMIQDPTDPEWQRRHDVNNFAHVLEGSGGAAAVAAAAAASAGSATASNPGGGVIRLNDASRRVFEELQTVEAARAGEKRLREASEAASAAAVGAPPPGAAPGAGHVTDLGVKTSGRFTASFTSTGVSIVTRNEAAVLTSTDLADRRYAAVTALGKKAHVRLETSLGALNLELECALAPRTCENFLLLARRGYYDGTLFHRSIRNFMIQGGDPTGTGRGGASASGRPVPDEYHQKLSHSERGILSMANSGPGTTQSQFFITFKSCAYLDKKHNVFGRVVGGLDVLRELEVSPVGADDRPRTDLRIVKATVFTDPFAEVDAAAAAAPPAAPASTAAPPLRAGPAAAAAAAGSGRASDLLPAPSLLLPPPTGLAAVAPRGGSVGAPGAPGARPPDAGIDGPPGVEKKPRH